MNLIKSFLGLIFATQFLIGQTAQTQTIAYWDFNEGNGATVTDMSNNGNNGTISGAEWVAGYSGNALSFNGLSGMVEVPHSSQQNVSSAITIEAIIKPMGPQNQDYFIPIVLKNAPGSSAGYAVFIKKDNKIEAALGGTNRWITSQSSLTLEEWHLIVVQFDGNKNKIYIDNILDAENDNSGTIQSSSYNIEIGGGVSSTRGTFNGVIDVIRISNVALNPSEFLNFQYNTIAYWDFNEGDGTTLTDISKNGNDGTISDATWVPGYRGHALSFDGVKGMVEVPHNPQQNASAAITIEAIIKPMGLQKPGLFIPIVLKNSPGSTAGYALFVKTDNKIEASLGGTNRWITSQNALTIGKWHFIVVQFDGNQNKIYIDRKLDAENDNSGTIKPSSHNIIIGGGDISSDRGTFNGIIDMIRISGVALEPSHLLTRISADNNINKPDDFELFRNYPNPFNPSTQIVYQVKNSAHVKLNIFSVNGKLVRTLVDSYQSAGIHEVFWDGKTENMLDVAAGQYLYRLEVGGKTRTGKALLLR